MCMDPSPSPTCAMDPPSSKCVMDHPPLESVHGPLLSKVCMDSPLPLQSVQYKN